MTHRCKRVPSLAACICLLAAAPVRAEPLTVDPVFDRAAAQELERKQRCLTAPTASESCVGRRTPPPPTGPLRACANAADRDCDMSRLRPCAHANDFNCRQGVVPAPPRRCLDASDLVCAR